MNKDRHIISELHSFFAESNNPKAIQGIMNVMSHIKLNQRQMDFAKAPNCKLSAGQVLELMVLFPFFAVKNGYNFARSAMLTAVRQSVWEGTSRGKQSPQLVDPNNYFCFCELKVSHSTTMGLRNQLLLDLYKDKASVFTLQGITMAYGQELDRNIVKNRMIGYVRRGEIQNPRKGIYAKPGYDEKELACLLYTPSYISLEYVLQRSGIIFSIVTKSPP